MVVPTPGAGHGLSHPRRRPSSTGHCSPISLHLFWVEPGQFVSIIKKLSREKESDLKPGDESSCLRQNQNHRITAWWGLEGTSVGHPVQPPAVSYSRLHRTLRFSSQLGSGRTGTEPRVGPVPGAQDYPLCGCFPLVGKQTPAIPVKCCCNPRKALVSQVLQDRKAAFFIQT